MNAGRAHTSRALLFAALEALSLLVGFLMQPLLMRAFGPGAYGPYALAVSFGIVAATVTDFGFGLAGIVRAVGLAGDAAEARRHFWAVQGVKALAGAATLGLAALVIAAVGTAAGQGVLVAMAMGAVAAWCFPGWYLLSRQRLLTVACSLLLARLLCLAGVAAWVRSTEQLALALLLTLSAPALAGLFVLLAGELRAVIRPTRPGAPLWRQAVRDGLSTLWLSGQGVVSSALLQSLLFTLAGSTALGLYAAADRVRAGVQGLFTAFGTAVFPRLVQQQVQRRPGAHAHAWQLLRLQLLAAAAVAVVLALLAPQVVRLISGPGFEAAVPVLRLLALALPGSIALAVLGLQILVPRGRAREFSIAMVLVLLLQVALLPLLAPSLGATGAAGALLACEGGVAAALAWRLRGGGSAPRSEGA